MDETRYVPPGSEPELGPHEVTQTPAPLDPQIGTRPEKQKHLTPKRWGNLSNNLYMQINSALSARQPLENNLRSYRDAYDLLAGQKDFPYVDSSNLRLPFTAGQLEALVAYICGAVVVPRLFMVTGNTPEASQSAHLVEQFYNAEFVRLRTDGSSYYQALIDFFHLALRDGTAYMEILWNRKKTRVPTWAPVQTLGEDGNPATDEMGRPQYESQLTYVDVTEKDYPEWRPVPLKDFLILPVESRNIQEAPGCARVEWPYETDLNRMKFLDPEEVERALNYVQNGNATEVSSDRQGNWDKDASRQLQIGVGVGTQTGKEYRNRGPIKVWRIHSNLYDMNGDGIPEENVFWLHEQSQRMLGWIPYDYPSGQRPFFGGSPLPRPDEAYGYSLIERLAGVQTEMDAEHNARQDRNAMSLFPSYVVKEGSKLLSKGLDFTPGKMNEVESTNPGDPTVTFMQLPPAPISSFQEESLLKQYGTEYTGLSMPGMGAQSSGRRSATEMKQQSQSSGTRLGLISMRLRVAIGQMIDFTHRLNKQYLRTPPQTVVGTQAFTLPLDVLMQDYAIGVSGATDPVDSATRRQETLAMVQLVMNFPEFQQDAVKRWHLLRLIFEAFNRSDTTQIIGTQQDAVQAQQAQQQAMQQQQAMAQQQAAAGQPPQKPQGPPGH